MQKSFRFPGISRDSGTNNQVEKAMFQRLKEEKTPDV
jgi:hypothetical protein